VVLWFVRFLGRGLLNSKPFRKLLPPAGRGLLSKILLGILCVFRLQAGVKAALITFLVCSHPGSLVPVTSGSAPSIGIGGVFFSSSAWLQHMALCWRCCDRNSRFLFRFVWPRHAFSLCFTLLLLHTGVASGVIILPSIPQLV
jgi:hypothetical protein